MKNLKLGNVTMTLIAIAAVVAVVVGLFKHDVILVRLGLSSVLFSISDVLTLTTNPAVQA